jgi:PD-(D/E)XK endonuclease
MAELKRKGNLGELKVAADLVARGCNLFFPFGEDSDIDLIAEYQGRLHRVQAKFTKSDGCVVVAHCRSLTITKGKVRRSKIYTAAMVDWIVVYDQTTDRCYYVPSWVLGEEGHPSLRLRLTPARNGQSLRIRRAEDYLEPDFSVDPSMEPAGFEPAASCLQSRRSAN